MVLDELVNCSRYLNLHPLFEEAFEFLVSGSAKELSPGKHEIRGEDLYVVISKEPGKPKSDAVLEAHKRYIDIQFTLAGLDTIGWSPISELKDVRTPYDPEKDFMLFNETPQQWIQLPKNHFVIFFPEDGHAPMVIEKAVSEGELHKAVVKIKL